MQESPLDIQDIAPTAIKYSKFSHSLDKIFRGMSLVDLQNRMRNKTYFNEHDFIREKNKKLDLATDKMAVLPPIQTFGENFDLERLKKAAEAAKNSQKLKADLLSKNGNKQVKQPSLQPRFAKPKINAPEPGKYNPNYSAVYRNVPSFMFQTNPNDKSYREKARKIDEEKLKILINKLEKKQLNKEKSEISRENPSLNDSLLRHQNSSRQMLTVPTESNLTNENSFSQIFHTNPKNSKSLRNKKNNGISFEKYSSRKDIFKTSTVETNVLTYLEPTDLLKDNKKILDFNKMRARESNFEQLNTNPSCGYYNPKYSFLDKNVSIMPFKKKAIDKSNKYYLIQKLWRSYNVSSDYKTVQLENYIDDRINKKN